MPSFKRRGLGLLVLLVLIVLVAALYLWLRPPPKSRVEPLTLEDGSPAVHAIPGTARGERVLVAVPAGQGLNEGQLLALADTAGAEVLQVETRDGDCAAQAARLGTLRQHLDGEPTLVAGSGPGAALAWRWLAGQGSDKARALSVDFAVDHPDCPQPLPTQASHGRWSVAWNDSPDDDSARFARDVSNAETLIADYDTALPALLDSELQRLLQGTGETIPVVEVPAPPGKASDTVTLFYSGDGGWRDLDRDVAAQMAELGYPVVGVDTLRYYWQHKTAQQSAADLSHLMHIYREKWGAKRFVLMGFSFGANVLPSIYGELPDTDRNQVDGVFLMSMERSLSFEIRVQGWLGKAGEEAPVGPELAKLPTDKLLCIYGEEEADDSGCTLPESKGENLRLPGGHHYDEDYPALAKRLVQAILKRQKRA
ncbi:virulence factor family protein [Pseudomonas mangiferae]|uniref:Virulence factor family protein n=1 Tax=Pseudomonas mangiferae TaxID=2593654 RepID=A0A553H1N0_9PSED|nr:AcvB/VirJ family lysyl-phosphatidylglycerol hydrolase [Pseudomonas mangiferae]TRX75665.1 virulence factor family protein [Pseudomonas mangiferae]